MSTSARIRGLLKLTAVGLSLTFASGVVLYLKCNYRRLSFRKDTCWITDIDLKSYSKLGIVDGFLLPEFAISQLPAIEKINFTNSDIIVASFPKSGTTWVEEIVFLIHSNQDFALATAKNVEQRFPYLEYMYPGAKHIGKLSSPRLVKTHLPLSLLPVKAQRNAKIIYVVRNPKDICVSYYYFHRMLNEIAYRGSFRDFFLKFTSDRVIAAPWHKHVLGYLGATRAQQNILVVQYEDLKNNSSETIRRIGGFLGRQLGPLDVEQIRGHTDFICMKQNDSANYSWWASLGISDPKESEFLRKGQVGDWKNYFTDDMNETFDEWFQPTLFSNKGLVFQFE